MKSYIQGLITGGLIVLFILVFIGSNNKDLVIIMENQVAIMQTVENHDKFITQNNSAINSINPILDQLMKTDQSIHETLQSFNERSMESHLRIKILEQKLDR